MNVLLFKFEHYIAEENRFGFRSWKESPSAMPLAANYLRRNGFNISLLDQPVDREIPIDNIDVLACYVPLCDGLPHALLHLERLKKQGKTTILVGYDDWEGMQQDILRDYDFIDFAVRGLDREIALKNLLTILGGGDTIAAPMPGIIARIDDKVVDGGLINTRSDNLDHLLNCVTELTELGMDRYDQYCIRIASGCPFNCTYCHIGCRRMRNRPVDEVIKELKILSGGRQIRLGTTDMLLDREWTEEFLNKVVALDEDLQFDIDARADTVIKNKDILPLLKQAGCTDLAMGGESFHPDILKATRKGITYEQYVEAAQLAVEAGMKPTFCMMLGHPLDSDETLGLTFDRIQLLPEGAEILGFQYLRPLPGSKVEQECIEAGLLERPMNYRDAVWARNAPMMNTKHLSKHQLVDWLDNINMLLRKMQADKQPASSFGRKAYSFFRSYAGRGFNLSKRVAYTCVQSLAEKTRRESPKQVVDLSPHNSQIYRYILSQLQASSTVEIHAPGEISRPLGQDKVHISLRHDVDFLPERVTVLTDVEKELGLRSVIHVILDTAYYDIQKYLPLFLQLQSEKFLIGLHSTAPSHDMPLLRFNWERELFKELFGNYPTMFTNHGACPAPADWSDRLTNFRKEVEQHLEAWSLQPSTQWIDTIQSVEDSGNGGRFSFLHDEFFSIAERQPGQQIEVLTHAEHWIEHPIQWDGDNAKDFHWLEHTKDKG